MTEIQLVYRDKHLLVAYKPSKLLSVPGRGEHKKDSLIYRIQQDIPEARIVHRLDYDTSGLMVLATNADTHRQLSLAFEQRRVDKRYLALIQGQLPCTQGVVDLPLALDWHHRPKHRVDFNYGKNAQTAWKVIKANDTTSLVHLYPYTGRSHQLRVHLLQMNTPIMGDPLYHPTPETYPRLCLHAQYLSFEHPVTQKRLAFEHEADFVHEI